jgi:glucose/arabinose dehydrogenase
VSKEDSHTRRNLAPGALAIITTICSIVAGCAGSGGSGIAAATPNPPIASLGSPSPTPSGSGNVVPFLSAPSGFRVTYVSKHVPGARFMAFAPNGDLVVSETSPGNIVVIAPGSSPDALPASFASALALPHGIAFLGSKLYVATWSGVMRYDYPSKTPTTLFSNMPEGGDHNSRSLAIAGDGSIFVSSGSTCNLCAESDSRFATVLHYGVGDTIGTIYSSGLRNASGLAFDASGTLWAVVNQRDNIGPTQSVTDNLPPDELDRLAQSANFGWPQCYPDPAAADRLPNPEYPSANCAGQTPAALDFQAHSAPLGIAFYNAAQFPALYRGNAFVAFHGSWNRSSPTGDKVVRVTFAGGAPTGYQDFVTGWLQGGSYHGRPVGVAVAPDGSLYISDDQQGYIYRVSYGP